MHPTHRLLTATASLLFALPAAAQHGAKQPGPLPTIDLDRKVWAPPDAGPSTAPKSNAPESTPARWLPAIEPAKATDTVTLPNGRRFELGLPRANVVYDVAPGAIWADGDNFKAGFSADGMVYVPFFGSTAPRNFPLAMTLDSVRAGNVALPLRVASPRLAGDAVTYDRGGYEERYELARNQVEQKFVFATPFAGELTIAIRVATELRARVGTADVQFHGALGHVRYTHAVLIDANGRRSAMSTTFDGTKLTLHATAASLANAAFPITVDPIVTTFTAATSSFVLVEPDTAYASAIDNYLVAWTRVFSATDTDLHSVLVDANGNVVAGSSLLFDNTTDRWDGGRVAVSGSNFLAVASRQPLGGGARSIWGRTRAVAAATSGAQFEISSTETGDKVTPDVGGEFGGPVNFCVVWQRNFTLTDHDIHYRIVTSAGAVAGAVQFIDNNATNDDLRPRIANSDGELPASGQVWPVVWQRLIGATQRDIFGARVAWNGVLATAPFGIDTSPTDDDQQPSVTSLTADLGGAKHFLVSYTTNNPGNLDIYARAYRDGTSPALTGAAFLGTLENLSATQRARNQLSSDADTDGCRFAVAYVEEFSATDNDAYVSTLDLDPNLRAIDPRVTLTFSSLFTGSVSVVADRSGGASGSGTSRYGASWDLNTTSGPSAGSIEGTTYRGVTPGGGFAVRATACGGLNISTAAGSQIPAPGNVVQFDLSGALGPAILIVGLPIPALSLCPPAACALGVTLTVTVPGATLSLLVPCAANLVGGTLAIQGAAFASPGGCVDYGVLVTSDTIDMTIR